MDLSGQVKRRKVNRRVGLARMEGEKPGAKKSFTQLYVVSRVHGVRGMALNVGWSNFGTKKIIPKLGGGMC